MCHDHELLALDPDREDAQALEQHLPGNIGLWGLLYVKYLF